VVRNRVGGKAYGDCLDSVFPVFLNTVAGVANCDPKLIEVGKVLGYRLFDRLVMIILPAAFSVSGDIMT